MRMNRAARRLNGGKEVGVNGQEAREVEEGQQEGQERQEVIAHRCVQGASHS